jgi:signal transduction histidine kinase
LESELKREGNPDFKVHPITPGRDQYPVVYLEPETAFNEASVGRDNFTDPVRREAMEAACSSGQPTLSGLVSVPSQNSQRSQTGFLLYCPIYAGGVTPSSGTERKRLLVGFVYSRFRGGDMFRNVLEGEARHDLNIEIFDAQFGKPKLRFYRSSRSGVERQAKIVFDGSIPVQGRQWVVRYHSSVDFEQQSADWLVNYIPIVGYLAAAVLAALSFSQVRAYKQLKGQTAALVRSEAYQRVLANIGAVLVESGANDQVFHIVGRLVVSNISDWFAVCLATEDGTDPHFICDVDEMAASDPTEHLKDASLLPWLLQHRLPIRYELSHGPDPHLKLLQESGTVGVAVVPMSDRHGPIGVVVAGNTDKVFDEDQLHLLAQIALRMAVAVDSDRLLAEKEQELVERRKVEAQIRGLNENLEQIVEERTTELKATNKELEAFCYSVSHDLRAPLRSVDGFSKSLLEDYSDQLDDQAREYISRVRNASHRMDELISALLNLSRITRLEIIRQKIDITELASVAIEDALEGQLTSRFDVFVQPGMSAEADPKLVRVIFDNLARNAVKFTAPRGRARIEAGCVDSVFFVRDNGVGFNPAYSDKLFVAFERLHTQTEFPGSGIGLATVQRIVQRHGGRVWAESTEGKGAAFFFTLRAGAAV